MQESTTFTFSRI